MSFQIMTALAQAQLEEYKNAPLNEETLEEIKNILFEYCQDVEDSYGAEMTFKVWPNPDGSGFKYEVIPASQLDTVLLKNMIESQERVMTHSSKSIH